MQRVPNPADLGDQALGSEIGKKLIEKSGIRFLVAQPAYAHCILPRIMPRLTSSKFRSGIPLQRRPYRHRSKAAWQCQSAGQIRYQSATPPALS